MGINRLQNRTIATELRNQDVISRVQCAAPNAFVYPTSTMASTLRSQFIQQTERRREEQEQLQSSQQSTSSNVCKNSLAKPFRFEQFTKGGEVDIALATHGRLDSLQNVVMRGIRAYAHQMYSEQHQRTEEFRQQHAQFDFDFRDALDIRSLMNFNLAHPDIDTNTWKSAPRGCCHVCLEDDQCLRTFQPCGHAVMCSGCTLKMIDFAVRSNDLKRIVCPTCRNPITGSVNAIFLVRDEN